MAEACKRRRTVAAGPVDLVACLTLSIPGRRTCGLWTETGADAMENKNTVLKKEKKKVVSKPDGNVGRIMKSAARKCGRGWLEEQCYLQTEGESL